MSISIFNSDCFDIFPLIKEKSIDLVIVDLPYAQTACKWDIAIDLEKMWVELKRCCTKKCLYVFFCTTKFGFTIIKSNPKWFKYDLVWSKSKKVGFLSANKMPLRKHEMIYVFGNSNNDDLENKRNKELKEYSKKIYKDIGKPKKKIMKDMGNQKLDHFFRFNSSQFGLPTKEVYDKMVNKYNLIAKPYEEIEMKWKKEEENIYNPQMKEGKPYKTKGHGKVGVYGSKRLDNENKGTRHPDSILEYEPEHEMVYVFGNPQGTHKTYNPQKIKKDKPYIDKRKGKTNGSYYRKDGVKRELTTQDNKGMYHPDSILKYEPEHEMVYVFGSNTPHKTYNPQKVKGKPYTHNGRLTAGSYGLNVKPTKTINKGTRHPNTILQFKNPSKPVHRTQKPVDLIEWLIKSYSNKGDMILDFTAGSGTTGIACMNTERKCILVEMDSGIFKILDKRITDHEKLTEEEQLKVN